MPGRCFLGTNTVRLPPRAAPAVIQRLALLNVELGVEGVEVLGVQLILCYAQGFAETGGYK